MNIRRSAAAIATSAVLGLVGATALAQPASASTTATVTAAAAAAAPTSLHTQPRTPVIATEWAAAWNSGNPQRLADLFVANGARYTDHDFNQTF